MGLDASAVIGEQELAGTTVNPRGFGKRAGLQQGAGLAGEAAAAVLRGRTAPSAETPSFSRIAYLAVTQSEVALLKVESSGMSGRLGEVLARVSRSEVVSAEVSSGALNTPVTIAFSDGGSWEFEVSRLIRKRAQRVVDILAG
jgi:hypothetical protein